MFGIGMPEFILILIVALVVLGPKKLPEMARSIGRALAEFKKSAEALKENLDLGEEIKEIKKEIEEITDHSSHIEPPVFTPPVQDQDHEKVMDQEQKKLEEQEEPGISADPSKKAPDA